MKKLTQKLLLVVALLLVAICVLAACDETGGGSISVKYDKTHVISEEDDLESIKPYLTVTYTDAEGNSQQITDYTLSGKLVSGDCQLTVSYNGYTAKVTVNVAEISGGTLRVEFDDSCVLYEGDDPEKLKDFLTVTYVDEDGKAHPITDYKLKGELVGGPCKIMVYYNGYTAQVTVNVEKASGGTLRVEFDEGCVLYEGDDLETVKDFLTVTYVDEGGKAYPVTDYELMGELVEGLCEITVYYNGHTAQVTVNVEKASGGTLRVEFDESCVFYNGDDLETLKPYFTVTYTDEEGNSCIVTDYRLSSRLIENTLMEVAITYNGITEHFVVDVTYQCTLSVENQGYCFHVDDKLEKVKEGLRVYYTGTDGKTDEVHDYELIGTLTQGECELTVAYNGLTAKVVVDVVANNSLMVKRRDDDIAIYDTDDLFTIRFRLYVMYTDSNGNSDAVYDYTLEGTVAFGKCELTVTYKDLSTKIIVDVLHQRSLSVELEEGCFFHENDNLETVKKHLTVTYTDEQNVSKQITDFRLQGELKNGKCQISVIYDYAAYQTVSNVVQVNVVSNNSLLVMVNKDAVIHPDEDLDVVKEWLTVIYTDSNGVSNVVNDYKLEGSLNLGNSSYLTVTYKGITQEVSVTVSCNHVFSEKIEPATCAGHGILLRWCTQCGYKEEQVLPQLPHTLTHHDAIAATCQTEGNVEYWYCSGCETYFGDEKGEKVLDSSSVILPKAHVYDTWVEEVPATCTTPGTMAHKDCFVCGGHFDADGNQIGNLEIAALGHATTDWIEDWPATCTKEGARHKECSVCHETLQTETIPFAHQFGNWVEEVPASCTEGTKGHYECSLCHGNFDANGEKIEDLTIAAQHDIHVVGSKEPTCTECGWYSYEICLLCDYTTYVEIPALGHKLSHVEAKATNCQEEGNVEHWHCSTCQKNFGDSKGENELENVAIAKAHLFSDWIDEVPATCTENGTKGHYECSVCNGYFDVDHNRIYNWTIYTSGHNYKNGVCDICGQEQSEGLQYELSSDQNYYIVTGIGTCTANDIVIPSVHGNLPVKAIGDNAFSNCSSSTSISITIPDSVVSIGSSAFESCYLRKIVIPNSVTSIGSSTFKNCDSLQSVTLPNGLKTIPDYMFYGCDLSSITIPASVTTIGDYAFYYCSRLTSITIPSRVTSIGDHAFSDCGLTSIEIPSSVTSIGDHAFSDCGLTSIEIPSSVTSIGSYAFLSYGSLTAVHITDLAAWCNIEFSDGSANPLRYAHNLYLNGDLVTELEIPSAVTEIKNYVFEQCSSLTSVAIPSSVTSIGSSAFSGCSSLTAVYITDIVAWCNIGFNMELYYYISNPLYYAHNLYLNGELVTELEIPSTVTEIKPYAFCGGSFTSVVIPDSVTCIGAAAFYRASLEEMTIPFVGESKNSEENTYFGYIFGAESYSYNGQHVPKQLKKVTVTSTTRIDSYAFWCCAEITNITLSDSVTSIGISAFGSSRNSDMRLEEITLPFVGASKDGIENTHFGYIFGASSYYDHYRYVPERLRKVTITSAKSIDDHAFYCCDSIISVVIPSSVTSIGTDAFLCCYKLVEVYNLSTLTITVGSEENGMAAYYARDVYSSLSSPSKLSTDSNGYVSYSNGNKRVLVCYNGDEYNLELPSDICEINQGAFYGCSIRSIAIPSGVVLVGSYSFDDPHSVTDVYITDIAAWCNIVFDCESGGNRWGKLYLNGELVTKLEIPATITEIKQGTFSGFDFAEVVIPSSVTSIGDYAFSGCRLTNIEIPSSVTSIGDHAFDGCSSLTSIIIPSSVTSIGSYAFSYCSSLTSIVIPSSVTSIGDSAFYDCSSLTNIEIPNSVTSIGDYAFSGCRLTNIEIPNSVTSIGSGAFYGCSSLTTVTFGENGQLESIGSSAFSGCSGLTSIEIPSTVTSIGHYAFASCTALTEINYNATNCEGFGDEQGNPVFAGAGQNGTKVTIGASVQKIPNSLFAGFSELTEVIFEKGSVCASIGSGAFRGCSSLTSIEIPSRVTSIGDWAFYECTALTEINYNATNCDDLSANNAVFYNAGQSGSGMTVTIGANVQSLPDYLFDTYGEPCTCKITKVVFEKGSVCASIGRFVLAYCSSLTSIEIPSSVTSIGSEAFYKCSSLTAVHIADIAAWCNIEFRDYAANPLYYAHNLYLNGDLVTELEIPSTVTEIRNFAFYQCSGLASIEISATVTAIGDTAFAGCSSLTEVTFGKNSQLESIGSAAFSGCSGITGIEIPSSVTSVGSYAFYGSSLVYNEYDNAYYLGNDSNPYLVLVKAKSTSITTCNIHKNTAVIAGTAFSGCSNLTSIEIPDNVASIGSYAFSGCRSLTSIEIPDNVASIGSAAFYGCSRLANIVFGENSQLESIGYQVFYGCSSLTSIELPSTITLIGYGAFYYCSSLTSIVIPSSVTSIYGYAFYGCSGLTSIEIPSSVTSIASYAFYGCSGLTSIEIPSSVTSIASCAFYGCSGLTSIEIPASVTSIGSSAFSHCSSLESITVEEGNAVYHSDGNCLIETATKTLILGCKNSVIPTDGSVTSIGDDAFSGCSSLTSIEIPASVTSICSYAFSGCSSLTSIELPSSITSIGSGLFLNCSSLTSIEIPDNVTLIGSDAFRNCSSLTSVTFGENSQLESIGSGAFYNCSSLTSIEIPDNVTSIGYDAFSYCSSLTSIVIPSRVTSIGAWTFKGCDSLTSIDLPSSVTSIGAHAFSGCSSLTRIVIPASVTSIDDGAFSDCSNLTIYCEAESQPGRWNSKWNYSNCPVVWGYVAEEQ